MFSYSGEHSPRELYYPDETSDRNASFFSKEEFYKAGTTTSTEVLVVVKYFVQQKCHIINYLLTSLARSAQRNIRPRSFAQTSPYGLGLYKKTSV